MDRQVLRITLCAFGLTALSACTQSPQKMLFEAPMRLTLRDTYVPPRYDRRDDEPDDDDAPRSVPRATAQFQPAAAVIAPQPPDVALADLRTAAVGKGVAPRHAPPVEPEASVAAGPASVKLERPESPHRDGSRQPVRPAAHTLAAVDSGAADAGLRPRPNSELTPSRPAAPESDPAPRFMSGVKQSVRGEAAARTEVPAARRRASPVGRSTPASKPVGGADITPVAAASAAVALAPPAVDVPPMTLSEIEQLAIERNPSIRQASAVAQKAIGTRQQVGLLPNPTIGYYGQEIGDDGTYGQQGLQVEQVFVRGDKLALNQRVADQEVQRLLWQVQVQRQRVLTDVRRQFYATLGAQQRMQLTQELEQLAADAADKFRLLFENQQGTRADQLQAEILMNEIAILRQQAANERDANWRQLATLMGSPDQPPAELAGELESAEPGRDWQQSVAHLLSASPQLRQAYAEAQRAQAAIRRAEVQKIPNVEVQASVVQFAQSDNVGANLTVGLPIPFFNKNQGNVHRAWSEYHRAQNNVHRLKLATQSRLAEAFGEYRDAAIRVGVMQQEILPRQAESVALIEQGYGTQFDFLRLFSAQRGYYEARVQYLQALVALRQSEVLIDGLLLTGGLDAVDDAAIDDELRGAALDGR